METIGNKSGLLTTTPEARASLRREYKDSVFRLLFNNKENVINLYNAIAGKEYTAETQVNFTTIEEETGLQLTVKVYNINNECITERCSYALMSPARGRRFARYVL